MKLLILLLFLVSLDTEAKTLPKEKKNSTSSKKSEKYQFSGLRLKGELKKPELSYIYQRKGIRAEKIIPIPENFDEEIINGSRHFE